ncbi:MAG TPA: indolepyruvate oxidoreductase subunit beta [Ramlibacter sp.]|nr:indolepyruvate oxidoreductase subunit beta [Ramlibacter sp.]
MNTNILVVGVGGQGVMTAAELLARVALSSGMDACKTEIAGMSQRGGVVSSQVRIGPHILASEITPGQVDLLLALEAAEALRWSHWLAPTGRAIVNTLRAVPPIVSSGKAQYPDDPVGAMLELGYDAYSIDAGAIAVALGDTRLANTVMLGAAADSLPFTADALLAEVLRRFGGKEELRQRNAAAFEAGRERMRGQSPRTMPARDQRAPLTATPATA